MIEITQESLKSFLKYREDNSHKYQFGHLLIAAGCDTMPGAAILATGAALKSGCGLVTLYSTEKVTTMALTRYPSAMCMNADFKVERLLDIIDKYTVFAIGPGLGREGYMKVALLLREAARLNKPVVLDADGLNAVAQRPELFNLIPSGSVLTPHEGELRRLVGNNAMESFIKTCQDKGITLVKKGFHTEIYAPEGIVYINTTGNPGMAKAGSGDVLTGLIGGLMARGYSGSEAARLGVWIHGYAGDLLSAKCTSEAYNSADLIEHLHKGFRNLYME